MTDRERELKAQAEALAADIAKCERELADARCNLSDGAQSVRLCERIGRPAGVDVAGLEREVATLEARLSVLRGKVV